LSIYRGVHLLLRLRRGAAGNDLGTTINYLRQTKSGAGDIGLGTPISYPSGNASIGLGTTIK